MELALDRRHGLDGAPDAVGVPEHLLLLDTAQALEEVQHLLQRSRTRASRLEELQKKAVSDQENLIAAQSRRITSLEDQLIRLRTVGDDQAEALDQALTLVAELESRMTYLERVNTELQALLPPEPCAHQAIRPVPDGAPAQRDFELICAYGSGDDLTRYSDFLRARAA